jgi:hypothetical protein
MKRPALCLGLAGVAMMIPGWLWPTLLAVVGLAAACWLALALMEWGWANTVGHAALALRRYELALRRRRAAQELAIEEAWGEIEREAA